MVTLEVGQYRTKPTVRFTITAQGKTYDLTNKTINFVVGIKDQGVVFIRRPCSVVGSPTEGRCDFKWEQGDTDVSYSGLDAELELILPDGNSQTIAQMKLNIYPTLGGG
jgi:hypothetical protein